jgi:uncharacterized protein YfaS (alpha-2-macroglobulin family)
MNRRGICILLTIVFMLSLALSACKKSEPKPEATVTPTIAPTVSATPSPTPVPVTPTPLPPYTPPPPGSIPPYVIQRSPERGEELGLDWPVELVFDRPMDRASVEGALVVAVDGGETLEGEFEWDGDRAVRFKPSGLARDARYHVYLGQGAKSQEGTPLDGAYRFKFNTTGFLEVTQAVPADGSTDVEADGIITVMFNRPVVPLTTISLPGAELPHPLAFDPPIEGTGEWLNTSIYIFTPSEPLAGGTTYTARVQAGLGDTTGGLLTEDYVWQFTTFPPEVVWVTPYEDQELIPPDTAVVVQFNQKVDSLSAVSAFRLFPRGGENVPGEFESWGDTLIFTPTTMLDFDTTYLVEVAAGVQSASGGEGMREPFRWSFKTVPLPRIIGTEPDDGERAAHPYTSFEIEFNAPIDPTTVMPNLEMTPPLTSASSAEPSPTQVYTYSWGTRFVLSFGAQPDTEYEVRIGPDIADPYGNKTGQSLTVRFHTRNLDPIARLHVPDQVGTYDADQPARLFVAHRNVERLDLQLYRLSREQFFQAIRDWWDFTPGSDLVRDWSVDVSAPKNEIKYTAIDLVENRGRLSPGIYLLDVTAPGVEYDRWGHRHILVVSEINLTLKVTSDEALVWATDLSTGAPIGGLTLLAQDWDGQSLGRAVTGEDGLIRLELPDRRYRGQVYVYAEQPFVLASENWNPGIGVWDFGFEGGDEAAGYRSYVYTDREIYRPDQTVYFRGLIRAEDDVKYTLPGLRRVRVRIYDANYEELFNDELSLDEYGAFDGEIALSEGASLGYYQIQVEAVDLYAAASFQVAAYRPPEFEVAVTPDEAEILQGVATQATVDVSYFFGGPVADVQVQWNVLAESYTFKPLQFGRYSFRDVDDPWICWDCWWWRPSTPAQPILSGSGQTDRNGQLVIELPANVGVRDSESGDSEFVGSRQLTVEAMAYGRDGQVISGRSQIIVHQGEFYIGLAPQQYVGEVDEEMAVDVVTVDWDGERWPDQELDYEVYRREWVNTFVEDEAGGGRWTWETQETLVTDGELATDANAEGVVRFTPTQGGSYHVVVSGRDRGERLVRSSLFVWVSGPEYVSWRRENNDRITLISDKTSYAPGETAEILIPSPFEGEQWAWITVERGGVLHQEVLNLESNSQVYRLPITAGHAPNVYVSAVVVQGREPNGRLADYKVGYVALDVSTEQQELTVSVTPSTEKAGPGDMVAFELQATDYAGNPVAAEFSLDLVDKAVLTLSPRTPDAIVGAFYGRRGLGVQTASGLSVSVNRLLLEELEEYDEQVVVETVVEMVVEEEPTALATASPMPAAAPMEGADRAFAAEEKAAAPPPGVELREEFADTAYWRADVVTDQDGQATVEVTLPDNLTTWVMRGVGATVETQVGEATTSVVATKPLLVRPVAPRFFVVDDHVQLAANVSNNTDEELEVTVAIDAIGLTLDESAHSELRIAIPAGREEKVTWWVTVEDVPNVDLIFSAVADVGAGLVPAYSDAARPRLTTGPEGTLKVFRYTAPEVVGTGGQIVGPEGDSRTEAIVMPTKYDDWRGELSVQLDPSLAAGMRDGLDYLEHFEYECTEQTVSRFLPNVLTYRALRDLGLADPALEARLPDLVEEGLTRLYLQQHYDGGWGWWYDDESSPYLTSYVVFALVKADEAGFEVRGDVIQRGLDFLNGELVPTSKLTATRAANRQAWILYVMAEAGERDRVSEWVEGLYEGREKLSHYSRAYLAMTLDLLRSGDERIKTLLADLNNDAILSATGAHWEEFYYDWWAMNTDTRSTAIILDALAKLDPDNALIPNVVRWLMVARRDGIWETTQETAWSLIALTDWMVVTGELEGAYNYGVSLNGSLLDDGQVTPENIDQSIKLRVDVADLLADVANYLTISRGDGPGRLYYTAHLKVYLPVEEIEPLDRGIIVSRQYTRADCIPTKDEPCPEVTEARVGDVIQVKLTIVAPHDLYYLVVEDMLPAGAEAIDTSLDTTSLLERSPALRRQVDRGGYWYDFYWWWWHWYSRSELRDEKVVLFADYLYAGTYEYTYTFRAVLPGEYQVIPTFANEFYFPEVFGRGEGELFTINE